MRFAAGLQPVDGRLRPVDGLAVNAALLRGEQAGKLFIEHNNRLREREYPVKFQQGKPRWWMVGQRMSVEARHQFA